MIQVKINGNDLRLHQRPFSNVWVVHKNTVNYNNPYLSLTRDDDPTPGRFTLTSDEIYLKVMPCQS